MTKRISRAIVGIQLALVACATDPISPSLADLHGSWDWVSTCGGFAGTCWVPTQDGPRTYAFEWRVLTVYAGDRVEARATFHLGREYGHPVILSDPPLFGHQTLAINWPAPDRLELLDVEYQLTLSRRR